MKKSIIITGGAGFIGSHVVRLFVTKYPNYQIINVDNLTYAGNLENIKDIENEPNYLFEKGDIVDATFVEGLFQKYTIDGVIHLAAESHVDRSITDPLAFVMTNVIGTVNLLQAAKNAWKNDFSDKLFYHVSTDEVYGELHDPTTFFTEETSYDPRSPYSASKASSDHFVRAYHTTYGLPIVISNCSNNYGPNHFPEKLIPLMIHNIKNNKPLPVYGKGENVRDWLFVKDHARAIDVIYHEGQRGGTYNIGGNNEWKNIDLENIEPFTIVYFDGENLVQWQWNSIEKTTKEFNKEEPHIWSSATLYEPEIRAERANWFIQFLQEKEDISADELLHFHQFEQATNSDYGLQINRNNILKTVSITQCIWQPQRIEMHYLDLLES